MNAPNYVRIEDLPTVLRYKRGRNAMSDVAEATDIAATSLSRLESGDANPTLETLEKLAAWLDRPLVIEP